ncbi:MAG: hypothetical protein LBQ02_00790 [Candidatus Nomurabacteria bacterium]|jgi:hypothetical protein|nr:hypothetical protein [Candidatus Nomurabacteria bacterium]
MDSNQVPAPSTEGEVAANSAPVANHISDNGVAHVNASGQKPHVAAFSKLFSFKYILSLTTGWLTVGFLIAILSISIHFMFNQDDTHSAYSASIFGALYSTLLASAVVFAVAHIFLYAMTIKNAEARHSKITRAAGLIFSGGLALSALGFVSSLFYVLFGPALGLLNISGEEIGENVLVSLVGVVVASGVMVAHLIAKSQKSGLIYASSLGVVLLTGTILLIVLPIADVRGFVSDDKKTSDLSLIESAINSYVNEHSSSPKALTDLPKDQVKDLKGRLSDYDYTVKSTTTRTITYELCAGGFTKDTLEDAGGYYYDSSDSSTSSSFYEHGKGKQCWTRQKTIYSSIYYSDDEDDYYDYDGYEGVESYHNYYDL